MPDKPQSKTTRKKQRRPAPAFPMFDLMQGMLRYPKFRLSLPLWQSMEVKQYAGLTHAEDRENIAPRTAFRVAAIMEAQDRWLSRSIQDIKRRADELLEKAKLTKPTLTKPTQAMWTEA